MYNSRLATSTPALTQALVGATSTLSIVPVDPGILASYVKVNIQILKITVRFTFTYTTYIEHC